MDIWQQSLLKRLYVTGNDRDSRAWTWFSPITDVVKGMGLKASKHLQVMFAGQNLLNSSQPRYVAEIHTPAGEIERGLYAKVTWSF